MNGPRRGHLNNVIPFSSVDGPGNRFVLFMQGCNFNCVGCHNPYTIDECNGCGVCIAECPEDALSLGMETKLDVDRMRCTDCEMCVAICPYDSTPLSSYVTVEDMVDQIRPVAGFLSGVTVSGGEATLQAPFVAELFAAIKADPELSRLTTFVDSNGAAKREIWDLLAPVTDGVVVDLKALDPDVHMTLTGNMNRLVLESIGYLEQIGLLYEVRLLIVSGHNDGQDAIDATITWLRSVTPDARLKVIGHRNHGTRSSGISLESPKPERLGEISDQLSAAGYKHIVTI